MYPKAPTASAFSRISAMSWAVTKATRAASLSRSTMILQASRPPMTGISMSIKIQSNRLDAVISTAFFPLSTIEISVTPRRFRIRSSTFWLIMLSSTMSTFKARGGYLVANFFLFLVVLSTDVVGSPGVSEEETVVVGGDKLRLDNCTVADSLGICDCCDGSSRSCSPMLLPKDFDSSRLLKLLSTLLDPVVMASRCAAACSVMLSKSADGNTPVKVLK
mmetsp:Transcript_10322/g.25967  ORF Transcript_10322/g.25967 Transcript_10322/m.25967 type:complete len:219 (+) Transcript_10322:824-1480(+)